jgi:hypothetical protein
MGPLQAIERKKTKGKGKGRGGRGKGRLLLQQLLQVMMSLQNLM